MIYRVWISSLFDGKAVYVCANLSRVWERIHLIMTLIQVYSKHIYPNPTFKMSNQHLAKHLDLQPKKENLNLDNSNEIPVQFYGIYGGIYNIKDYRLLRCS